MSADPTNAAATAPSRVAPALPRRAALLAALAAPVAWRSARAQEFPSRPVRVVVPFTPGGAADITARLLAERMTPLLGQPVVVENKPGAGGNIAAEAVARSGPDGHTVFLGGATILCANKYLYRSIPFDPLKDFAHVSRVSVGTTLLVVNGARPWRNFRELAEAARKEPGRITMASSGQGTISHLSLAKLMHSARIQITHIPYRGLTPGLNDLIAGTVDMMFDGIPGLVPHVREGQLRALAVGSARRVTYVPGLEEVPSMGELLPGSGMDMEFWYCISAPAGTPPAVLRRLHEATVQAVRSPDYGEKLRPLGFTAVADDSPAAFATYVEEQLPFWRELVEVSGAQLE